MCENLKLFITASGKDGLAEENLWNRIVSISQERLEETVVILSEGRQNTPISERYMKYLRVKFTMFIPNKNRCFDIQSLIIFQPATKIPEHQGELMCSISLSEAGFKEDLLFVLAHDLAPEYDLYWSINDEPPSPLPIEQIQERLQQQNYLRIET